MATDLLFVERLPMWRSLTELVAGDGHRFGVSVIDRSGPYSQGAFFMTIQDYPNSQRSLVSKTKKKTEGRSHAAETFRDLVSEEESNDASSKASCHVLATNYASYVHSGVLLGISGLVGSVAERDDWL